MTNQAAPRVYRTEALVLKGYDYGEADRILTLLTPHSGKMRAIAKGVRRTKSRMSGHLDLFTRSTLLIARGRQLDIVTQAETVENFRPMRGDLVRVSSAHYVAEILDEFSAENLPNYPLYALAIATLRQLGGDGDLDLTLRSFEMQSLAHTGYRPQLHRCLQCGTEIVPGQNRFSPKLGGILCPDCGMADSAAPPISVPALKLLRHLQTNPDGLRSLTSIPVVAKQEVEQRLQEYVTHRMEGRLRSVRFLEQVRADQS
ncbi:MAG TPA: DNA repair protein RecO [Chloroflexota bacterium]|nr:DNA repair protein RecO [Chloroflexota bacterium]